MTLEIYKHKVEALTKEVSRLTDIIRKVGHDSECNTQRLMFDKAGTIVPKGECNCWQSEVENATDD